MIWHKSKKNIKVMELYIIIKKNMVTEIIALIKPNKPIHKILLEEYGKEIFF